MRISVIIATYNRAEVITGCLDSVQIALAQAAPLEAEVLVIDNASTDCTAKVVQSLAAVSAFPIRLVFEPLKGLSYARNRGLRNATGDLLVFTDDDCKLQPNYIVELLRYDAKDTGLVFRGGSVMLGDASDLPLTIKARPEIVRWSRQLNSARHENLGDTLLGCNMAMRKEVADLVGPFDVLFGAGSNVPGGEDTDYIFRAYLAGVTIEFVPDMLVYHFHGRRLIAEGTKLFQNYSMGGGALFAKYALIALSLCRPLYWDIKNLMKEIMSGSNAFMPSMNFSYKSKLWWYCIGIKRYAIMRLKAQFARVPTPDA
jgi:glycosyltransferase involved in cell wall biosynthesis